jgi:hypothetical protein
MSLNLKDQTPSFDRLVHRLENHGYRFMKFEISTIDPCLPVDVEWNYKDIAHVEHLHSHIWREFTYVGGNTYSTLDLRNLFGISIPQSTTFYATEDNRLIAQSTLFLYIILVEVSIEQFSETEAKTSTRYAVGVKMRIGQLLFPMIRRALLRNWEQFMEDDRSMRIRRGELRKNGFTFVDNSPVNMRNTMHIQDVGVRPPAECPDAANFSLNVPKNLNKIVRLGNNDHLGLQVSISDQSINIFPRLCPHRGASLDTENCDGKFVTCPWHGRKFGSLCSIKINGERQALEGPLHSCIYDGKTLEIAVKKTAYHQTLDDSSDHEAEWTKPWSESSR